MSKRIAYRGLVLAGSLAGAALASHFGQMAAEARDARRAAATWRVVYSEDFQNLTAPQPAWNPDTFPNDGGTYTERGSFFLRRGILPPSAFRFRAVRAERLADGRELHPPPAR